jgi:predicted enzyme related to lactoylglutathione lyase
MIRIATTQLWVLDQDEALEFYTKKVGWEIREDVTIAEMGNFRWVSVAPPGTQDPAVVLMAIPGPPVMSPEVTEKVRELVSLGFAGTVFLETDDVQKVYEELSGRGVEFSGPPEQQPYGLDTSFRDPSGNNIRLAQRMPLSP